MKKILAFTLAETLIVMGIIGIVSALTLPNLNSSTANKEKVVKLKKLYQNLDDAFGRAQAVYGPVDEWFINDSAGANQITRFAQRMSEFMKITKDCGIGTGVGCVTQDDAKYFDGSGDPDGPYNWDGDYKVLLADGASLNFFLNNNKITIHVDIDGPNKGANAWNKELFAFEIDRTSVGPKIIEPVGKNLTDAQLTSQCFTPTNDSGACTAWVIQNENMDYLKATKGKCTNNTVLSWTNTTCK